MFKTSEQIHQYYLEKTKQLSNDSYKILKTDIDNEVYNSPNIANNIKGDVFLLEYNINLVRHSNIKKNLINGDIRYLPYKNNTFDLIIDLSTIDHVPETIQVINEYNRVLKKNGTILIFVWCGNTKNEKEWNPSNQYYINLDEFINCANTYFTTLELNAVYAGEPRWPVPKNHYLYEFIGVKK